MREMSCANPGAPALRTSRPPPGIMSVWFRVVSRTPPRALDEEKGLRGLEVQAMSVENAFAKLTGRPASPAERERLYRLRDALGLRDNDAFWSIVMALEYYDSFWRKYPEQLAEESARSLENARAAFAAARCILGTAPAPRARRSLRRSRPDPQRTRFLIQVRRTCPPPFLQLGGNPLGTTLNKFSDSVPALESTVRDRRQLFLQGGDDYSCRGASLIHPLKLLPEVRGETRAPGGLRHTRS